MENILLNLKNIKTNSNIYISIARISKLIFASSYFYKKKCKWGNERSIHWKLQDTDASLRWHNKWKYISYSRNGKINIIKMLMLTKVFNWFNAEKWECLKYAQICENSK